MAREFEDALRAVDDAKLAAAQARLADPDEHFNTWDRQSALDALNTPPEAGTNNHPPHWYTSEAIIEATDAYIVAQQDYLANPGDATKEAYEQAKRDLSEARRLHRQGRPMAPVAVAGDANEIETRNSAIRALGKQGYDAGTIANLLSRPVAEVQGALNGLED